MRRPGKKRPKRGAPLLDSPLDAEGNPIWAGPSRSHLRREASSVSDLALHLVRLPAGRVATLPLNDALREAIDQCTRMARNAHARQLRLVGKLLRELPKEQLEELETLSSDDYRPRPPPEEMLAERWRKRLLTEGDQALSELLHECPSLDRQQLRHWVRAAQGTVAPAEPNSLGVSKPPDGKARRAARHLLRAIRAALLGEAPDASDDAHLEGGDLTSDDGVDNDDDDDDNDDDDNNDDNDDNDDA